MTLLWPEEADFQQEFKREGPEEGLPVLRFLTNTYTREESPNSQVVEQRVEWLYAFVVMNCNSFFPVFVMLYVIHYFFVTPIGSSLSWFHSSIAIKSAFHGGRANAQNRWNANSASFQKQDNI
ncbi:hypothetical protein Q3G72_006447 [Acer saccharum]|nr:hypothetical protein Q3G72_006447 [Acer saccharum]